jgi:hypothetical protein
LRGDETRRFTDTDRLLAVALTLHEDGLHRCGHPRSLAFEDYNDGLFEIREEVCHACAVIEQHKVAKDQPGSVASVVNTLRTGEPVRWWNPSAADKPHGQQGDPEEAEQQRDR